MPLCSTDWLNQLVRQSGFDSQPTVSTGNYKTGKDTSSWGVLFTVPVHSFVPEVAL